MQIISARVISFMKNIAQLAVGAGNFSCFVLLFPEVFCMFFVHFIFFTLTFLINTFTFFHHDYIMLGILLKIIFYSIYLNLQNMVYPFTSYLHLLQPPVCNLYLSVCVLDSTFKRSENDLLYSTSYPLGPLMFQVANVTNYFIAK